MIPEYWPPVFAEFLSKCWAHNHDDHPTFKEITENGSIWDDNFPLVHKEFEVLSGTRQK